MNTIWFLIIVAITVISVASLAVTLRSRPTRVPDDPELVARMRDALTEAESRKLAVELDERVAEIEHARDTAPQRTIHPTLERVWAGGV